VSHQPRSHDLAVGTTRLLVGGSGKDFDRLLPLRADDQRSRRRYVPSIALHRIGAMAFETAAASVLARVCLCNACPGAVSCLARAADGKASRLPGSKGVDALWCRRTVPVRRLWRVVGAP
jgi:hypothetical protein